MSLTHKHLFSKHWGELIDIDSVWKDLDGDVPELIYSNPQFVAQHQPLAVERQPLAAEAVCGTVTVV